MLLEKNVQVAPNFVGDPLQYLPSDSWKRLKQRLKGIRVRFWKIPKVYWKLSGQRFDR